MNIAKQLKKVLTISALCISAIITAAGSKMDLQLVNEWSLSKYPHIVEKIKLTETFHDGKSSHDVFTFITPDPRNKPIMYKYSIEDPLFTGDKNIQPLIAAILAAKEEASPELQQLREKLSTIYTNVVLGRNVLTPIEKKDFEAFVEKLFTTSFDEKFKQTIENNPQYKATVNQVKEQFSKNQRLVNAINTFDTYVGQKVAHRGDAPSSITDTVIRKLKRVR